MRRFSSWICTVFVLFSLGCQAEQDNPQAPAADSVPTPAVRAEEPVSAASYKPGIDYEVLPQPVPTVDKNKIEVTEVFWYGCGHCFAFEPNLEAWAAKLPGDVSFERSPAIWDNQGIMERHARIYYAAKILGVLDKGVHQAAFNALNLDKNPLRTDDAVAELFAKFGVSREDFDKVFNSFGVTSAVKQAEARQRSYHIQGTPELIVNGKYRVTGRLAGTQQGMLDVAAFLVRQERAAQQ